MRVDVLPIFLEGRPRPKSQRLLGPQSRGVLKVMEKRIHALGRVAVCASVLSAVDGFEKPLMPELIDAELIWVDGGHLRLRGNELVDGVLYGQTWEMKVA